MTKKQDKDLGVVAAQFSAEQLKPRSALMEVSLEMLAKILRLPGNVELMAVTPGTTGGTCMMLLRGPGLPAGAHNVTATYKFDHETILRFAGFVAL